MRTVAISNHEVEEFLSLVGGVDSKWGQRLIDSYGIYDPNEGKWPTGIPHSISRPYVLVDNGNQPSGIKYL